MIRLKMMLDGNAVQPGGLEMIRLSFKIMLLRYRTLEEIHGMGGWIIRSADGFLLTYLIICQKGMVKF